jgi:hypothetical protein
MNWDVRLPLALCSYTADGEAASYTRQEEVEKVEEHRVVGSEDFLANYTERHAFKL